MSSAQLSIDAWKHLQKGDFKAAWQVFDKLIELDEPDPHGLNNALYSVCDDNSGLGTQPERARRYLAAAEPHGEGNPAIFYTGACVLFELGERERSLEWLENALTGGIDATQIYEDPVFESEHGKEDFEALFAKFMEPGIEDTDEGRRIAELAADLGDEEIVESVHAALRRPPTTVEAIGFYPGANDNAAERCFRHLVSQLMADEVFMSVEDKYSLQIFDEWDEMIELPDALVETFSFYFEPDPSLEEDSDPATADALGEQVSAGYLDAMKAVEAAFVESGKVLLTVWTGRSDTTIFAAVTPAMAEKWCDVNIATTHEGESLGLIRPAWKPFAADLSYCCGIPIKLAD